LAKQYIELLKEVDDLATDARQHLPGNPKAALKPYTQLKELALSLSKHQEHAEGAAVHLVSHVEKASTQLWADMTKIMMDEFDAILTKANWPSEAQTPNKEWRDSFEKLLELQYPEMIAAREVCHVSCYTPSSHFTAETFQFIVSFNFAHSKNQMLTKPG
jgi:hypothetical protein